MVDGLGLMELDVSERVVEAVRSLEAKDFVSNERAPLHSLS